MKIPDTDILAYTTTESLTAKIRNYHYTNDLLSSDSGRRGRLKINRHGHRPEVEIYTQEFRISLEIDEDRFRVFPPRVHVVVPTHGSREPEVVKAIGASEPEMRLLSEDVWIAEIQYVRPLRPKFRYAGEISPAGVTFGHLFRCEPSTPLANDSWLRRGNSGSGSGHERAVEDEERVFFWCPAEWLLKFWRCGSNGSESLALHFLEQFIAGR